MRIHWIFFYSPKLSKVAWLTCLVQSSVVGGEIVATYSLLSISSTWDSSSRVVRYRSAKAEHGQVRGGRSRPSFLLSFNLNCSYKSPFAFIISLTYFSAEQVWAIRKIQYSFYSSWPHPNFYCKIPSLGQAPFFNWKSRPLMQDDQKKRKDICWEIGLL